MINWVKLSPAEKVAFIVYSYYNLPAECPADIIAPVETFTYLHNVGALQIDKEIERIALDYAIDEVVNRIVPKMLKNLKKANLHSHYEQLKRAAFELGQSSKVDDRLAPVLEAQYKAHILFLLKPFGAILG